MCRLHHRRDLLAFRGGPAPPGGDQETYFEGLQTSSRFTGDSLRQELSFPGSPDLSRWAGQPVVLRFRLQEASLYSFAFRR